MVTDKTIRSGDKTVDAYITQLEDAVESFSASNTRKLLRSIDAMAGKISKDLDLIASEQKQADGTEVELSNKIVDTYLKMVKESEKIKSFGELVDAHSGVPEKSEEGKPKKPSNKNKFEEIQNKIKENG